MIQFFDDFFIDLFQHWRDTRETGLNIIAKTDSVPDQAT